jgi:hypothetical protein
MRRTDNVMKFWFKLVKNNHIIKDTTITDNSDETRTHKVFNATEAACHEFDIGIPTWLDLNKKDFMWFARTRFTQDSFIETIEGDYLEIEVIEED